ncbi:VOC family protein [Massilia pseudoviolaceinigra]|uniref:VOC family protein n=1 Tax=Massilia pseudoviolaceinigra TaxID=3057165 RepID=UPI0027969D83|nr:VOC family protein [Massilia sp. CCM 9206]MDQ1922270.1 VOC family protein [Massilia sp. CCM 9206]
MSRAVHFEIQASNPQAMIDFYHGLFGWTFNKWEGGDYWMVHTGPEDQPGINGGLLPRRGPLPEGDAAVNAFVITVDVEDIDASLAKAASGSLHGVVCVPKAAVPGIGWLAYVKDPDGNMFGMMQADITAA